MLKRKISMTIPEFLSYQRGELTLKEIKKNREVEGIFLRLYNNKKTRKFIVTFLCGILFVQQNVLANDGITRAGTKILGIVQSFGYWACLVLSVVEITKSLLNGDTKGISGIILKYSIAFGSFYAMPWIFDTIKEVFLGI